MGLSNQTKINLKLIVYITISWLIVINLVVLHNNIFYRELLFEGVENYDGRRALLVNNLAVIIAGFVAVPILVFFIKDRYRDKPVLVPIFVNTFTFIILVTIVSFPVMIFYSMQYEGYKIIDPELIGRRYIQFLTSPSYVLQLMTWTLISSCTLVVLNVNEKYGQGVLINMIRGKYNKPKQEERIFMFLDLQSSTTMAEELGNIKYFELLRAFFQTITDPIIKNYGEIYQYVGDEIVVSWKMENGLKEAQCVKTYFDICKRIDKKRDYFLSEFKMVPTFRAGLHCGKVTVGEVGTIKKDIIFSGDVLNTTSRIEESTRRFDVSILISKQLIEKLPPLKKYAFTEIGEITLKGKQKPVNLSKVEKIKSDNIPVHQEVEKDIT